MRPLGRDRAKAFLFALTAFTLLASAPLALSAAPPAVKIQRPATSGPIDADLTPVLFLLKRQRADLDQLALAVSDPTSPRYGKYWSVKQIGAIYGASQATTQALSR